MCRSDIGGGLDGHISLCPNMLFSCWKIMNSFLGVIVGVMAQW